MGVALAGQRARPFRQRRPAAHRHGLGDRRAWAVEVLRRVSERYATVPLLVTENGAAFADELAAGGAVHDRDRARYLDAHLRACHAAIAAACRCAATSPGR
jgi:hypothetical protein